MPRTDEQECCLQAHNEVKYKICAITEGEEVRPDSQLGSF